MKIISFLIFIIVLFLGVTFAVLNAQQVTVNYYLNKEQLPLSLLLVIVLGIGVFVGWMTNIFLWLKAKAENRRISTKLKLAEKELTQLRHSPLNDHAV